MSDMKTLSDRIDVLETRLTFQDETIETLNKTITAQWQKIDALTRQLIHLSERLQGAESREPEGDGNEDNKDDTPRTRRYLFRTPAPRRVIGSVVEFLVHGVPVEIFAT